MEQLEHITAQYALALYNMYDELFEINISCNYYRIIHHTNNKYVIPEHEGEIIPAVIKMSEEMIYGEDKDKFLSFFDILKLRQTFRQGVKNKSLQFRKLRCDGRYIWAEATVMPVDGTEDEILLCYILDINEKKEQEFENARLLKKNLDLKEKIFKSFGSLYYGIIEVDVDNNTAVIVKSSIGTASGTYVTDYSCWSMNFIENHVAKEDRNLISKEFSLDGLATLFITMQKSKSFEMRSRTSETKYEWMELSAFATSDSSYEKTILIAVRNVNEHKLLRGIVDRYAYENCDCFIYLNLNENSYIMFSGNINTTSLPTSKSTSYTNEVTDYVEKFVVEEDKEHTRYSMQLDIIRKQLENNSEYVFYTRIMEPDLRIAHKRIQFSYYDKPNEMVLITRTDVTKINNEEKQRNELLKVALNEANMANHAKTNFLSRMSHDIRTPMNAIIGMTAIAKQAIENPNRVLDCLNKVESSAKFLLMLINDILDMSKIESGKMALNSKQFDFVEFIRNISSMFQVEISAKKIEFNVSTGYGVQEYYIGDPLKINQILINLLSNAIKFVDIGGKIDFHVEERNRNGNLIELVFVVKDNGIGMSDDNIDKIFIPFEQLNVKRQGNYVGSGLGLAIANSYVHMMNGNIEVHSKVNEGSTFIVNIWLKLPEKQIELYDVGQTFKSYNFLIVDDDKNICEYVCRVLSKFSVKSRWCDSGEKSVEIVLNARDEKELIDVVVLDLYMPVMSGIQTARAIKKLLGDDIIIIAMSAYDWSDIKADAKLAGIDYFLSKPLFPSTISDLLIAVKDKKMGSKMPEESESQYSFYGEKVLLVEDNELNMEIAKTLLEEKKLSIDIAENGKEAVEIFQASPVGKYLVILMDIQMPIMDGLEATKLIRKMDKSDSKTVPIIAMSANAFEEDVEKSLNAGMNAHLSKPVDLHLLFKTLQEFRDKYKNDIMVKETNEINISLEEALTQSGVNVKQTLERFSGNINLLERFIKKYPKDPTIRKLKEAVEQMNHVDIEKLAHTIKGNVSNLGFSQLSEYSADIVQAIRKSEYDNIEKLFSRLWDEYERLVKIIEKIN